MDVWVVGLDVKPSNLQGVGECLGNSINPHEIKAALPIAMVRVAIERFSNYDNLL